MKKNILFVLFYLGVILGTIVINMKFEAGELSCYVSGQFTYMDFLYHLFIRSMEIVIAVFILKAIPCHMTDYLIVTISGILAGGLSSIRALSGGIIESFLYMVIVMLIIGLYMIVIKIVLPRKCDDINNVFVKLHNSLSGKLLVITIMLINMYMELKILKFF